jgi:hypothetical protein
MVETSPHGGITPAILTKCLTTIDSYEVFERKDNLKPFLLLDGHNSRFNLKFVNYIRNEKTPWSVAFALPHGTHLWQVGDSPEQNGSFKIYESKFKEILLRQKEMLYLPPIFGTTDVVPIVNYAWDNSFGKKIIIKMQSSNAAGTQ